MPKGMWVAKAIASGELLKKKMNMKKIIVVIVLLIVAFVVYRSVLSNNSKQAQLHPLPEQFLDDRTNFGKVNQLFTEAMDLTEPPDNSGKPFDMSKDQQSQIYSKLQEGVDLSKQIDDSFLDYLNPELKVHYRNEYVKGNELFLEGLKGDTTNETSVGVKQQLEGSRLIGEWNQWWNNNKDTITNKAFAD